MLYTFQLLFWFPFILVFLYLLLNYVVKGKKAACVVVLGDIGRSPRIQYHAISLAKEGYMVDIVGYGGSDRHKQVTDDKNISVHTMMEPPALFRVFPRIIGYFLKVIWQSGVLGFTLLLLPKSGYTLLQNPPAIPTIAVCWLVSLLRSSHLVVDWHNYGYTILSLSLGRSHPLVAFSKWYERFFGKFAHSNLCVTDAMRKDLHDNWGVKAVTLYDRAPERFQATSVSTKHDLFSRLCREYPVFAAESPEGPVFTSRGELGVEERRSRPALLVSSTSWTEDEDFGILLSALEKYEEAVSTRSLPLPDLICVITGKGPQKDFYMKKISEMTFSHIKFCLPWLTSEDYPLLLGSADIGVCLHTSSSGLDLPMKVVDMFGCGLPVCAVDFKCLPELVKHRENGLVFHDNEQLSDQLQDLLKGFPDNQSELRKLRNNVKSFQSVRWHDQWVRLALPLFQDKVKTD
ncbi:chitobiosyldiphosphodolichol beta-mannosyltransferase-like [Haliotis cracherodii]|uniref:chitobiosyldiphosphodolichol beta-mannosyltransferase-like n=1 Tax=Haliotis cracherodii TaxID=6455 RepID=UPI0039EBB43A